MTTPAEREPDEEQPIIRANRLVYGVSVALAMCGIGFSLCWLILLPGSTPQRALSRTVDHMVWICPVLAILGLPVVLYALEKRAAGKK